MTIEGFGFHSAGRRLAATLKLPAGASAGHPGAAVAQGPGGLGLRNAKLDEPYHEALFEAGVAVLAFDYRGSATPRAI